MHFVITGLYGGIVWLSMIAYAQILEEPIWPIVSYGPLIVSGAMAFVWALEFGLRSFTRWVVGKSDARP